MSSRRAISAASRSSAARGRRRRSCIRSNCSTVRPAAPRPRDWPGAGRRSSRRIRAFSSLPDYRIRSARIDSGEGAVAVRWVLTDGCALVLAAKLSAEIRTGLPPPAGRAIWRKARRGRLHLRILAVRWSIEDNEAGKEHRMREQDGGGALDRLAERMGIEAEFRNARGEIVPTAPETKRRLLAAMGVAARDGAAADEALAEHEWLRPLAPVQVVRTGVGPVAIDLVLPADTGEIAWRLHLENGGERSGREAFAGLALAAERDLDGRRLQRRRLALGDDLPWGYHLLGLEPGGAAGTVPGGTVPTGTVIVTPGRCWPPQGVAEGRRLWGIAAQLYLLRSETNWGIGDFGDLRALVELAAANGADVIGINPLHALFPDNREHASPYSPASRLLLNVLNIDVTAVPELRASEEARRLIESEPFRAQLESCRDQLLVDYSEVAALKL